MASASPPELTLRSIATGIALGALLTPCNIYSGLKIGWSFNMSIAAGLLGFGFWHLWGRLSESRPLRLLENNINQTTASSAASIISGGLVAPIPAWTMLTGESLPWPLLVVWVFLVSALGIVVAAGLRNQMLVRAPLVFPAGVATAEAMRQIHSADGTGRGQLSMLLGGAALSGALKLAVDTVLTLPRLAPALAIPAGGALRATSPGGVTAANLGFAFDPSLLMIGFGAIIGLKSGVSLLIGAVVGWGVLAPMALAEGWAEPGPPDPDASWFAPLVEWLLWPGVTLMVVAALTAFALSLGDLARRRRAAADTAPVATLPRRTFIVSLVAALVLVSAAEIALFGIGVWQAVIAVVLSFALAAVAARVSGETGITPIGAMGKITQLSFGAIAPGDVTSNLMSANVTGGAAGQCADLMHDLKTGQIIGATPAFQILAQLFGVLTGSLVGTFVYILLIPDPLAQLITPEWPAPAVATWKAVAEVMAEGLGEIPRGATTAMAIAAALGLGLALAEKLLPDAARRFIPSAPAIGLAFVIPAWNSLSLFLGALIAALIARAAPAWAESRLIVLAAGLVAGESLAGVGLAAGQLLG